MKKNQNQMHTQAPKKKSSHKWMLLLIIALLLLALYLYFQRNELNQSNDEPVFKEPDTISVVDTLSVNDSVINIEEVEEEKEVVSESKDTVSVVKMPLDQEGIAENDSSEIDSLKNETGIDSLLSETDSVGDPCRDDTLELRVYPDPSGGLHYGNIKVELVANKECSIQWRMAGNSDWLSYEDEPISIDSSTTLVYKAFDKCGGQVEPRRVFYDLKPDSYLSKCPDDMVYVKGEDSEFCIDRYPWPNRKGDKPVTFVSLYEAMDSCFSIGKRLPEKSEWSLACSGPRGWMYPYGNSYEKYACATHEKEKPFSGDYAECRSYFGVYDMSGTVAEWTSTVSDQNRNFYNVMGGFWESGSQSSCFEPRYSYFPQNRHNPVGFRCVTDVKDSGAGEKGSRK